MHPAVARRRLAPRVQARPLWHVHYGVGRPERREGRALSALGVSKRNRPDSTLNPDGNHDLRVSAAVRSKQPEFNLHGGLSRPLSSA